MTGKTRYAVTRWIETWLRAVGRRAWLVVLLSVGCTAALLHYTIHHVHVDTDTTDMIDEDLPFRKHHSEYKAAFDTFNDVILVVIDGETPELAQDAATRLGTALRHDPEHIRAVFDPAGPFFQVHGLLYLDLDELQDLSNRLAEAAPLLGRVARDPSLRGLFETLGLALREGTAAGVGLGRLTPVIRRVGDTAEGILEGRPTPFSWQRVMTGGADGEGSTRRFLLVQPVQDFGSLEPSRQALRALRRTARDLGIGPDQGVRVRLTGSAALADEEIGGVFQDARDASLVSLVLVALLLAVGLRSFRLVVATLTTLLVGLVGTAAFATWAIGRFNLISVAFAVLFIGLGVDYGIHYCLRYREELRRGRSLQSALTNSGMEIAAPLLLSAGTSVIAFYSFIPTAYVGISELGIISGTGILIAVFANFTVLPALLTLMPLGVRGVGTPPRGTSRVQAAIRRHATTILVATAVLAVAALALVPLSRFDFDPINLRDPSTESVRTYRELAADGETPVQTIKVLAPDLEDAEARAGRLAALPEVERALTLRSFVPRYQGEKLEVLDAMHLYLLPVLEPESREPPTSEENRQALVDLRAELGGFLDAAAGDPEILREAARLRELLTRLEAGGPPMTRELERTVLAHLPTALDRLRRSLEAHRVTVSDLPPLLVEQYLAPDGRARIEVHPSEDVTDHRAMRRFVGAVRSLEPAATGGPVMIVESGDAVVGAFQTASIIAGVLIVAFLLLLLRSAVDTVLVLVPLLLAGLLTVAAGVLLRLPFNFANVIVLPLLLGLGVDSGIHIVLRERLGGDGKELLGTSTPRAVLLSSLTTVASFGTLGLSGHRGTASMGQLLTLAIAFTLLATLVVLPALMARTTGLGGPREPSSS